MKRAGELTPGTTEQTAVLNLVSKVQSVLDNLVVAPALFEAAVSIASLFSSQYVGFMESGAYLDLLTPPQPPNVGDEFSYSTLQCKLQPNR